MANLKTSAAYRIAFTYAAAFAAAILLLGVAVYFAADAEFRRQRDQALSEEVADLASEGDLAELVREIAERETSRATDAFGYALFDRSGKRIAGALDTPRPPTGFGEITFQDPVEGPDLARAKAIDLANGDRLVVAADSEAIETIDATILWLFGIAFIVILAVGAVGAFLLGRYLRHRLGAIATTANAIVGGSLDHRMPIGPNRDEFDAAALALNAMLDRIAGLMENLRQVSSDVAHDLRTPLLKLRGQLDQVGRVDGAEQRAIELGDQLIGLFAAILRIAEVEGGGLAQSFAMIDLSSLAEDVADSFRPALTDSGHALTWDIDPAIVVHGNRELLAQAITNLLDNARVHTPTGTSVTLSLDAGSDWVRLTVADDGPGVARADRAAILQRFYRTEASRTTPGNGLGLSLVGAVAAAHGGSVMIDDNRPGLVITIILPRAT
jgi:signal transduction histidine kinase